MSKITLNLQISQKKKTKKKTKRKNVKKYKGKIGRDLVKDNVGTNQLLDYNDLNNLLEANQSINTDDQNKYYDYIDNLRAQQAYQLYGGDPNEQYQLKKVSKKLYNNLKNSLFDDGIRQDNIVGPPPDDEPIISNSWDAVPGGTATSIGSARSSFRSSFVEPVENIGSSSSVQIVDAYNFPTANVVDFDPISYTRQQIRNKLIKDQYKIGYPSNPTISKWIASIKQKINDEGFLDSNYERINYKNVVRDIYTELYPDSVNLIRTPVKKEPEPKEEPKEIPKTLYYKYGEEAFSKPKLPIRRPKTKASKEPKKTQKSKKDLYNMFEANEQLMNYSTEIPKPLKLKQPSNSKEEIKKQRAINKTEKAKIKDEKKQIAIIKKEKKELEKEEKQLQKVLNPKTNKMVSINSKAGREITEDKKPKRGKKK